MKMFKKKDGFTLVELIVVIAILAILAGVAIPAYSGYMESANEASDITELDAIKTAAMAAYATSGEVETVTVTVENKAVTGVSLNDGETDVTVYPEPASNATKVQQDFNDYVTVAGMQMQSKEFSAGATWNGTEWIKTPAGGNG